MHIGTALKMLNAVDKIETTDLTGRNLKNEVEKIIISTIEKDFPSLSLNYIPGKGFATKLKDSNSIHKFTYKKLIK